jgi:hypothetical protein
MVVRSVARGSWKSPPAAVGKPRRCSGRCERKVSSPLTVDGAINGRLFRAWIEQHLAPLLKPGDIVV